MLVAELEERAEPTGGQRMAQVAAAESVFVVAVEEPDERLEVEGQVGERRVSSAPASRSPSGPKKLVMTLGWSIQGRSCA